MSFKVFISIQRWYQKRIVLVPYENSHCKFLVNILPTLNYTNCCSQGLDATLASATHLEKSFSFSQAGERCQNGQYCFRQCVQITVKISGSSFPPKAASAISCCHLEALEMRVQDLPVALEAITDIWANMKMISP